MIQNIENYKQKLIEEKERLQGDLTNIAHEKKEGSDNWEGVETMADESIDADANNVADKIAEFETNQGITVSLNTELKDIDDALARIENGTYGTCEETEGGVHDIEEDRLGANPSARTCKAHMK